MDPVPRGRLFVVSGPSGVGKGTVVRALRDRLPDLEYSVSCTTRAPRPGEEEGKDYHFLSPGEFQALILEDAFLEWADVYGHRYGTLVGPVDEARGAGRDVLLELDVQGAAAVHARIPDAVLIFLVPRSIEELESRLRGRGTEDPGELATRLAQARQEMDQADRFDHVVVNDDLEQAVSEVAAILTGGD